MTRAKTTLTKDHPQPRRPAQCPVENWLTYLGHRWTALILWHLQTSPKRHRDLEVLLPGITSKVLSERLQSLVKRGLISRSSGNQFPRSVSYAIRDRGRSLISILDRIEMWAGAEMPSDDGNTLQAGS